MPCTVKMGSMDQLYEQALTTMERFVDRLAKRVPPPQLVKHRGAFVFRHIEKLIGQAIVQKLVRMVSTLDAARLLQNHGFVQEQGALQRILDEIQEDILFLVFGVVFDDLTPLHKRYLDAFFEEEFDAVDAIESSQKRDTVPRKKIRAYNARKVGPNPSQQGEGFRTISKIYSGYVHVASPHVMDMYVGNPPRFYMRSMRGTQRHYEHQEDLWNYFYRGTKALVCAAKVLSGDVLFSEIYGFDQWFERMPVNGRETHTSTTQKQTDHKG